jgi:NAD(P)-dependent dehydrogenase (short-subunit alcohol dehydrogenase family)
MVVANRYAGRVVLVTGAARGIGRACAMAFAAEGALLVLGDLDAGLLAECADEISHAGGTFEFLAGDVSNADFADRMTRRAIDAYGRLDVAVNNAGVVHPFRKLVDLAPDEMQRMIAVNLMGVFHGMQRQIPLMEAGFRETGETGAILNVASVAGLVGAPLLSAYAAAKHAVVGLTRSAAAETARRGVRINALCPSFTNTTMVRSFVDAMEGEPADAVGKIVGAIPMRRLATPDEIVQAVLWICSPGNSFMTGQAIALDGGLTAV